MLTALRSLVLLGLLALPVAAADWPQWLGPNRDGSSTEKIKPWKGDLKVVFEKEVGPGHSSPVIAGGKVYLLTQVKDKDGKEQEAVTCWNAKTGEELWSSPYPRAKFFSPFGTGPQGTPAVVGGKVYSFGATGVLTCFDAEKGTQLWQVDTWKTFDVNKENKRALMFGAACSPLVDGEQVVVNVGGKDASVVAFTTAKGEVAWKQLDDKFSYSSGIVRGEGADRQLIFLTQQGVRGFAPKDGTKLWDYPLVDKLNESSMTPVKAGGLVLASSIMSGMVALDVPSKDGKVTAKWKNPKLSCYFSTPIPVGKHLYVVTGALFPPTAGLHCAEIESGKILWSRPQIGKYHAAMLKTADDKLLLLTDKGVLSLFEPNEKEYKELASAQVVKGEQIWAHPAMSDGKVYFRDDKKLICLQMPE